MICRSYINGVWQDGGKTAAVDIVNPANWHEVVSASFHATSEQASQAMKVAASAWPHWKRMQLDSRIASIENVLEALAAARGELAQAICSETGKTHQEGIQEVDAALLESNTQIDIFRQGLIESINGHQLSRESLGVVLLVTPSNFPLAAVLRKLVPALLAGNAAVVKSSELTPLTANSLFKLIDVAGFPAGVANLVLGEGPAIIPAMIAEPTLKAISITGSNQAGSAMAGAIGERNIRLQAEMGGSNAAIVLADADLDHAARAISEHAFACCGQWCTGTTRVIVEASVLESLSERLVARASEICIGPFTNDDATMGPLISMRQRDLVEQAISKLCAAGVEILYGSKRPNQEHLRSGYFLEPTVLLDRNRAYTEFDDEIFGPVVTLIPAADCATALELSNASRYGLSFSVFTRNMELANRLIEGADAGVCHVNLGTAFRDHGLPLFGWKESGRGIPECGTFARDFYTRTKAIYRAN